MKIPMISGVRVPQGSILRPTLWNILYDGLLRIPMPAGVELIAFFGDVALVPKYTVHYKVAELLERNRQKKLTYS